MQLKDVIFKNLKGNLKNLTTLASRNEYWMKNLRLIIFLIVLIATLVMSVKLYLVESARRNIQEDIIELSMVKYGLFNIDEWKKVVATVVTAKVEELDLTDANRAVMRKRINGLLTTIITDLEQSFKCILL